MKIAFIGGGNMGEAMLSALLKKKLCQPADIMTADISKLRLKYLQSKYGISVSSDNKMAVGGRGVVVLAIKPQNAGTVLDELKGNLKNDQLVLSIVAGTRIKTISEHSGHHNVVRVMPNTPAQIGIGMSGWTATKTVTSEQKSLVKTILGAMGKEIYFDREEYLDIVTAVSGSGPAYFFYFTELLIDAAVDLGLKRNQAEEMVKQTILGAANLLNQSDKTPAGLRHDVTSKGGTTEQAIKVFEQKRLAEIFTEALNAACQRAKELGEIKP